MRISDWSSDVFSSDLRDLPAITAIYAHHVLHGYASFETVPPSEAELGQRRAAILEKGLPYLVAEIDGAVMGYAYAGPYRPRIAYRFSVEDSMYVAQAAPRRGIGGSRLARVVDHCPDTGKVGTGACGGR